MKRLLLSSIALLALVGAARADVVLDTNGQGGTGDNVIFNSIGPGGNLILGTLNGQHNEIVRFLDLSGNPNFTGTGGQNGNDIKIFDTSNLDIKVFDSTDTTQVFTSRDIFSLKGSGTAFITVTALEPDGVTTKTFNFGGFVLGNGQSGFDLQAINGEVIADIDLFTGPYGVITDFEHYRIDVANPLTPAVPELSTWFMMLLGFAGVGTLGLRKRRNSFRFV